MPRTSITPTTLLLGATPAPVATTIDATLVTNGVTIPCKGSTRNLVLRVSQTAVAAKDITVRAAVSNYSRHTAARGNLVTNMVQNAVSLISGLEAARYNQDDGALYVDFATGTTGTIEAYLVDSNAA